MKLKKYKDSHINQDIKNDVFNELNMQKRSKYTHRDYGKIKSQDLGAETLVLRRATIA